MRIFSGEDGAGNTFPFWNLDKSGYALRGIWQYGNVVLVATESSQKNSWLLGRIVETFLDGRGIVGQVKVRTKTTVFESPVDKLCLLIEGDCSKKENMDNNSHRHLTDIRLDLSQLTYFVTVLFCKRFALELSLKGQDIVSNALKNNLAVNQLP